MAEFVWGTDYRQYLQNQAYVTDIRDAQSSAARDTIATIGTSSRSILLGVEAGMGHIADAQREAAQLTADAEWGAAQLTASALREAGQMTAAATEHAADRLREGFGGYSGHSSAVGGDHGIQSAVDK